MIVLFAEEVGAMELQYGVIVWAGVEVVGVQAVHRLQLLAGVFVALVTCTLSKQSAIGVIVVLLKDVPLCIYHLTDITLIVEYIVMVIPTCINIADVGQHHLEGIIPVNQVFAIVVALVFCYKCGC